MTFKIIDGGFQLNELDVEMRNDQRAITKQINDAFVQVGAVFLKANGKNPIDENWVKSAYRDTNLQDWIDLPELGNHNVGFNLQQGWVDIDIDADDPEYNSAILAALDYLRIDTRFRFGRRSAGVATHVLVQLGEDESANFDFLKRFEPREFRISDKRYHTQLRSYATNIKDAYNLAREAKQTVVPGSVYTSKKDTSTYDLSVWYRKDGNVAANVGQVAATTPRKVNFNEIVRAICFGTMAYILRDKWVEGSRQNTAHKVTGWLARVVADGRAINNHEHMANEVFCPIDDDTTAEALLYFICEYFNDDEKAMRVRTYNDACEKLNRNPDARIPGWPAIEQLVGGAATNALRTVFMPGSDVSSLTRMAERYVYDETDNRYLDRERFATGANFAHEGSDLERRHKGDVVRVGGKPKAAFQVFESSDMRKRVGWREMYPELSPGSINRISSVGEVLSDDDDTDPTALAVFNTWRGWPFSPAQSPDTELLEQLELKLNTLLGYLTRDNSHQIEWVKDWYAFTFQYPADKQQIAWVCVGGQGVGKSWVGNTFSQAMFGRALWSSASPKIMDGDFVVGAFKDRMFTFVDEAKFHSEQGTDEIKKLIRSVDVPGMEKFQESRNYRLFTRLMFASNKFDINVGQANTVDRALFYTRAYDADHLGLSELEFRAWTETIKPFFVEFTELMKQRKVKEHFMYMFMNRPVDRDKVESIKFSAGTDAIIVQSNMSWARRIAKEIVEDGRVFIEPSLDITHPFTMGDFNRRVMELATEMGLGRVQGAKVLAEFQTAGLIGTVASGQGHRMRFKHKMASLLDHFGKHINIECEHRYEFSDDDYGLNENDGSGTPKGWRGLKKTKFG